MPTSMSLGQRVQHSATLVGAWLSALMLSIAILFALLILSSFPLASATSISANAGTNPPISLPAAASAPSATSTASATAISKTEAVLILNEVLDDDHNVVMPPPNVMNFLHYVESRLGRKFKIKTYPWKRALKNAASGDGILFGVSKNAERAQKLRFSEPVYMEQSWLITRCDSIFSFNSVQDLSGKTIGVVRGTVSGDEFDRNVRMLFKVEDDTGAYPARFAKLYNRRVDALVYAISAPGTRNVEADVNQRYGIKFGYGTADNAPVFCALSRPVAELDMFFAAGIEANPALLNEINEVVLAAKRNGELVQFFAKNAPATK